MSSKERFVIFGVLLVTMLLLPFALKAATEQEIVDEWISNNEAKTPKRLLAPFFGVSYGKVTPDQYNTFANETSNYIKYTSSPGIDALLGIYRVTSFQGGFGLCVDKALLSFGVDYWAAMGSTNKGDFQVVADLGAGLPDDLNDFEMRSTINVWGIFLDYQYYLLNAPEPFVPQRNFSVRAGGGVGYYAGFWKLWDGFGGTRLDTGEFYELKDHLKGSGPGFHVSIGVEYPVWNGFVLAFDTKYMWLRFDKLSKRLSREYELYLVDLETRDPIEFDFSGPRASLTIKRFITF
jgi:hypothetical protein